MPEGFALTDEVLTSVREFGKSANLTQEQAQAMVDMGVQSLKTSLQEYHEALDSSWAETRKGWVDEVKADKELGGNNLANTIADANKAIRSFGKDVPVLDAKGEPVRGSDGKPRMTNDLARALEITGAGDHPVVVRMFATLGKLVGEGGVVHGNMSGNNTPLAQSLYSKSNMNP